jgi:hypothetical protein
LLHGAGWTAIILAGVALAGVWLSGPTPRARAARAALAPYLLRPGLSYAALAVSYLLLLWWRPTPQFGFLLDVVVWFLLAALGLEALRRQTAREFPDAQPTQVLTEIRGAIARARVRRTADVGAGELERLARLHAEGALDDDEFAAAKAHVLGMPRP